MIIYFNSQGGFEIKEARTGRIKTNDEIVSGEWDKINYISYEDYETFKTNCRHKDVEARVNEFNFLLAKKEPYEKAGGRIIAKRSLKGGEQYFRSLPIKSRQPSF